MKFMEVIGARVARAACVGFLLIVAWDCLWSGATTFRGMSFAETYVNALLAALVLALPTLLARKRAGLQLVVWLVYAAWLEANLMYCRTYLTWIPCDSYGLAGNLGDFTASVVDSLRWPDLILLIIPVAGAAWLRVSPASPLPTLKIAKAYAIALAVLVAISVTLSLTRGGYRRHIDVLSEGCYYATTPPVLYTPAIPLWAEATSSDTELTRDAELQAAQWLDAHAQVENAYTRPDWEHRDNLVIIFCESLEGWLIGANVDGDKPITPYLNSLLADSTTLYIPHVRSQVGAGRSIDAQLLMLGGMYPLQRNVWSMKYPRNRYFSLAEDMKMENPDTRAYLLTCDKPITWNQANVAKAFSIDTMLTRDEWRETELVGNPAKLSDGALMRQSVEKLQAGEIWPEGEPAYLHFITYSGHNPFVLKPELRQIDIEGTYPAKMADYMTMANYTDASLRPLIEYLQTRTDWPQTMVVIVGDHEGLGAYRNEWLGNAEAAKILSPKQEVPMIILNSPRPGLIDKEIGEIDVYSTIRDLLNLRNGQWQGMGQSALDPLYAPKSEKQEQEARRVSETIIRHNLLGKY